MKRIKRHLSILMTLLLVLQLFPTVSRAEEDPVANDSVVNVLTGESIVITTQPENVTVRAGESFTLTIGATGNGLKYDWQYQWANQTTWNSWANSNATSLSRVMQASWNNMKMKCVVTDGNNNRLESNVVVVKLPSEIIITKQPENVTANAGDNITLTIGATGNNLKYDWQYQWANQTTWTSWANSNTTSLSRVMQAGWNNMKMKCVITDGDNNKVESNEVVLKLKSAATITITKQPENVTADAGENITLTVSATGNNLKYDWQYQWPNQTTWTSWANSNTTSLSRVMQAGWNNMKMKCVITDGDNNKAESNVVVLKLKSAATITITKQPENVTADAGENITLTIAATGKNLKYDWQYQWPNQTTWTSWANSNTTSLSRVMQAGWNNMKMRCVITDGENNRVESNEVVLKLKSLESIKITKQPQNVAVAVGENITLTIAATGSNLKYNWQYQWPNQTTWNNWANSNSTTLSRVMQASWNNMKMRCVVTDGNGDSVTSDIVTISVKTQAFKVTYDAGEGAFPAGGIFAKAESEWGYTFNQNRTAASENLEVGGHYIPDWIAPEREGYNFLGWTLNGKVVRNVNVTDSDITLTAVWEAGIKVTYDANGGYWLFDEEEGSFTTFDMIQPAGAYYLGWHEPQRDGYQFAGWTVNDQYVSRINLTQPVTVKATWNKIYTVTYDANGGKFYNVWDDAQQKEITGTTMTRIQNDGNMNYWVGVSGDEEPVYAAQNEEMVFCGWSTNKNATPGEANLGFEVVATGNFTVYAIWTKGYTVTLNANGGVLYYENDVAVTSKAYTDYNPGEGFELFLRPEHREGCEFLGWSTNQKATEPTYGYWDRVYPSVNTTLYAIWQKYPTITYDANGGYWNEWDNEKQEDVQVFYRYEWRKNGQRCHVRNQAPDREGYRFDGWMDANGNVIEEENPLVMDKDYIVKAKWVKQIQVTYNANGGSWGNETLRYWDGEEGLVHIGEEWPQWNGNGEMCFAGWSTSPNATQADADFDVELHDDAVYYAIWCRPFTVTFDANGGWLWEDRDGFVTTDTRESVWYGDFDVDQWANRDGYEFLGWSTNKNAKAAEYPINGSGEERRAFLKQATTFYAVWEKLPWITYDANGGFWGGYEPENQIDERETTRVDWDKAGYYYYVGQEQPWRDGYEFNGWVDAQGNPADEREIIMGEDLTFYASWAKRIDVVYNANGGKFETGEGDMDEHVQNDVRTETEYWLDGWEPHYRLENGGEYCFVGWSLDPKGTEPIENPWMIPSNIEVDEHNCITLYAIWDEGITVTYNGNGGEWWISDDPEGGNWYSVNVREEGPYRSDEQTYHIGTWWPDREGYMFVGWSTNPRATDAMTDFDAALTQNTTYYAIWDKMPVITFNAGEGSFGNDAAAAGSTTITVPWRPGDVLDYDRTFDTGNQNIEPTRQGYRFNGWVDKDGNQFRYIRITGDVEVYASWVKAD